MLLVGNLHSGNVFIGPNGSPYLSEFEGYLLGASSILRPFFTQLKGPSSSAEAVDVYCFGHLLYEMAVGMPLQNSTCDNALPNHLPEQLSKFKSFYMNKLILNRVQGVPFTTIFFKGALLLQKSSDFKNFFTL